jgi:hypothetical protein
MSPHVSSLIGVPRKAECWAGGHSDIVFDDDVREYMLPVIVDDHVVGWELSGAAVLDRRHDIARKFHTVWKSVAALSPLGAWGDVQAACQWAGLRGAPTLASIAGMTGPGAVRAASVLDELGELPEDDTVIGVQLVDVSQEPQSVVAILRYDDRRVVGDGEIVLGAAPGLVTITTPHRNLSLDGYDMVGTPTAHTAAGHTELTNDESRALAMLAPASASWTVVPLDITAFIRRTLGRVGAAAAASTDGLVWIHPR